MAIRGSCLCGGVRFSVQEVIGPFEICHCNRCRKVSGSNSMAAVGVNAAGFKMETGHDLIRAYTAPVLVRPPPYQVHFCGRCGSPVPPPEPTTSWFEIPAGLLDDDPGLKPDKHIFVEFAPPWDEIEGDLPRYTVRDLARERYGRELPEDYRYPTHYDRAGDG